MSKKNKEKGFQLIQKLFANGLDDEKKIEKLSLSEALLIPAITIEELRLLLALQGAIKSGKVISFLAADWGKKETEMEL